MNKPLPCNEHRGSILANEDLATVAAYFDGTDDTSSPWYHFATAHRLAATDAATAETHLRTITGLPGVESRTYLQAWHCLRSIGIEPTDGVRSEVNGIVVEVGLDQGVDVVAAYQDHSARYINHSGAAVIWDEDSAEMNAHIEPFLEVAAAIGANTSPLDGDHPPPPQRGFMLINVLTPGGIHIGMGPLTDLQGDPMGSAVIKTAMSLMNALVQHAQSDT